MAGIGKTREQLMQRGSSPAMSYVVGFVAILVMCYSSVRCSRGCRGRASRPARAIGALAGAAAGRMHRAQLRVRGRPLSLWLINAGYAVVGLAIAGAIIGGWPRKPLRVR